MKIISAHKDFYDHFNGFYDTDDSIIYVRKLKFAGGTHSKICHKLKNKIIGKFGDAGNAVIRNNFPRKPLSNLPKDSCYDYVICGVYPWVMLCPAVFIAEYDNLWRSSHNICKYVSYEICTNQCTMDKFLADIQKKSDMRNWKLKDYIKRQELAFKWDCKESFAFKDEEIFRLLKSPVFAMLNSYNAREFLTEHAYNEMTNDPSFKRSYNCYDDYIITDCSFVEDFKCSPLKYHMDMLLNNPSIYSDIESFIFSMSAPDISEPSNSTKILNAGFDLKTSFRNMK